MNIHFKCPVCGKHLEIDEAGAGMTVPCTDCSTALTIPAPTAKHTCPQCNVAVLVDDNLKDETFECSNCHGRFYVPNLDNDNKPRLKPSPSLIHRNYPNAPNSVRSPKGEDYFQITGTKEFDTPKASDEEPVIFRLVQDNWGKGWAIFLAVIAIYLIVVGSKYLNSLSENAHPTVAQEPMPDKWQIRYDQLYAQALASFMPPPTNGILEIATKNNRHYCGKIVALTTNMVVLDIDGRQYTYNRDWLSPQTRADILALDYAESFARKTVEAEQADIERLRVEKAEAERMRIERIRTEQEEAQRLQAEKAQAEKMRAERDEADKLQAEQEETRIAETKRLQVEQAEASRLQQQAEEERRRTEANAQQQKKRQSIEEHDRDPEYNPLVQAALIVQGMLNNGTLMGANFVTDIWDDVPAPPPDTSGNGNVIYITPSGQRDYPNYDIRCYVIYNFTFRTQAGFIRQNQGRLVFSRYKDSKKWEYNPMVSTIDSVPGNSLW